MERVIHVDERDEVLGAIGRHEAHERGLLHRAGCVFLVGSDGRVGLARRASTKALFASCVDVACSFHVEWGESYGEAAARELMEETGVSAPLRALGVVRVEHPLDRMMVAVYVARSDEPIELDPGEASEVMPMTPSEVDAVFESEHVTPWLRQAWPLVRAALSESDGE